MTNGWEINHSTKHQQLMPYIFPIKTPDGVFVLPLDREISYVTMRDRQMNLPQDF